MSDREGNPTDSLVERWTAEQLGLPPEASAAEARTRALRRLEVDDFAPTPEIHWAAWLAAKSSSIASHRPDAAAQRSQEQLLKNDVEQFAAVFFSLPCNVRKRRWREFMVATEQVPQLARRVQQLGPGLSVDLQEVDVADRSVREVAQLAAKLFVLPHQERARVRQEWLLEHHDDLPDYGNAWDRLDREYPQFAGLAPDLPASLEERRGVEIRSAEQDLEIERAIRRRGQESSAGQSAANSESSFPWHYVGVIALMAIMRLASSGMTTRQSHSNSYSTSPAVRPISEQELRGLAVMQAIIEKSKKQAEEKAREKLAAEQAELEPPVFILKTEAQPTSDVSTDAARPQAARAPPLPLSPSQPARRLDRRTILRGSHE